MLEARDEIEQEIWWEPTTSSSNIWFDNWTKLGALYHVVDPDFPVREEDGNLEHSWLEKAGTLERCMIFSQQTLYNI